MVRVDACIRKRADRTGVQSAKNTGQEVQEREHQSNYDYAGHGHPEQGGGG
jgi:hypothetical protein